MKVLKESAEKSEYSANFFTGDETLMRILKEKLPHDFYEYAVEQLMDYGKKCANEIDKRAKFTDRDGQPVLKRYDKYGEEVSEVWVNEGYEKTVEESYRTGMVGYVHKEIPELNEKGNYLYSFSLGYLVSQTDPGFYCPVTLTMATAYLLDHYADDEVKKRFLPHVCATGEMELYEGATFLTERQGGSDVGANVVKAVQAGDHYRLYGEKYFASNAGRCGVAMVLARREGAPEGTKGLTLFAVPWNGEDGKPNQLHVRRLKDKLGVRSVPSGEVEFDGAIAYVVGDETRGFYYMMEALNLSRICNAVASIGIMKRAYQEARQYAEARHAFGQSLLQLPMIKQTLSRLQAKLEVEVAAVFDLITLYDKVAAGEASEMEVILHRLYIAILKKETAETAIHFTHEAIEMHGGNGYIEDFVTPRLLRDAQVLTVWEGTANVLGQELIRLVNKFSAHELFIEAMADRLEALQPCETNEIVSGELNLLAAQLQEYAASEAIIQQLEAKPLMQKLAYLYESIVALEWAERYGGKYEAIAQIYIETTWKTNQFGKKQKSVELAERVL
ncbi:acyl-CoA dehydrogenase family protein [Cytobacillus purgationiresistens]|uniref:Alkylation response protein AidB-like acyl-CoA dehydrogenase n=1 Tax=Cytobacillus purgationiresistens TaxID=863449 RepID=A0ABU0AN92_9BACI|nr:acyl-CoA dehydrogenase family protein [Cytobacillus purgationiresistens]MDQ0272758.1 alkylation response protein AidB-like acyl-CoA dehydrogenase [Cytobacillus purgationiresistens]